MIRRTAFRFSENNWWHWLLLIGADRVNMIEGLAADLREGRLPNVPAEMGIRAEWEHNRPALITKVAVASALAAALAFGFAKRRENPSVPGRRSAKAIRHR